MTLEFTRIAQELVYKTLKQEIYDTIAFPLDKIHLMSPAHQYVNSRTETTNGLEQDRFPALSIISIKDEMIYDNNNQVIQQDSYDSTDPTKIWISDIVVHEQLEFCVSTTTKKDYRYWHNAFKTFFEEKRIGIQILNDVLPESSEYMNIVLRSVDSNQEEDLNESTFIVEVRYRIFKEFQAYLVLHQESYIQAEEELEIIEGLQLDDSYLQWASF
jgi:hypothetical protein